MYSFSRTLAIAVALGVAASICSPAQAQDVVDKVQLVSSASVAADQTPTTQVFTISTAGTYSVTLTDSSPAPLASLQLAIATPSATLLHLSAAGTMSMGSVMLQPGLYYEQVLATPSNTAIGGSFSAAITTATGAAVPVTPVGGATPANVFVGAVAGSGAAPPAGQSVLQTQFTVVSTGTYQLTWADLGFPAALQPASLDIAVWNQATPGTLQFAQSNLTPGTVALGTFSPGTYELVVIAQAAPPANAGLYTLTIGTGAPPNAFAETVPVGTLLPASTVNLQNGATLSLTLGDLAWPAALAASSLQAVLVQGATVLQTPVGPGTYNIANVPAGSVQLFVAAQPAAGGEGSYAATLSNGATELLDIAEPVTDSSHYGYTYITSIAGGSYQLGLTDFAEPAALSSAGIAAEQRGVELGSVSTSGASAPLAPQPQTGVLNLIAFAAPSAQAGLFGLALTASSSGAVTYQTTQGVGADFSTQQFSITSAGNYQMTLTDLGFPASFGTLHAIVTSGAQSAGHIDAGGEFTFQATPGNYTLNVLAETGTLPGGAAANYGMYGAQLAASAPSAPTGTSKSGGGGGVSPGELAVLALVAALRLRRAGRSA
jgi:hypothetical protein